MCCDCFATHVRHASAMCLFLHIVVLCSCGDRLYIPTTLKQPILSAPSSGKKLTQQGGRERKCSGKTSLASGDARRFTSANHRVECDSPLVLHLASCKNARNFGKTSLPSLAQEMPPSHLQDNSVAICLVEEGLVIAVVVCAWCMSSRCVYEPFPSQCWAISNIHARL